MRHPARSLREHVEVFHLHFLRVLGSGTDKAHHVVKGGCNLRFWLGSVRYSADLDLDVVVTARGTLQRKIERMLAEGPLATLLRGSGLRVAAWSAPKQTETTQRWKVMLEAEGVTGQFPTKIEFSRRPSALAHAYEPVVAAIATQYRMVAPLSSHYLPAAAIQQKIVALAHRVETQARDVFDLGQLFASSGGALPTLDAAARRDLPIAIDRALSVEYDDYSAQVSSFLEPEHRDLYASREAWDSLQTSVIDTLGRGLP